MRFDALSVGAFRILRNQLIPCQLRNAICCLAQHGVGLHSKQSKDGLLSKMESIIEGGGENVMLYGSEAWRT